MGSRANHMSKDYYKILGVSKTATKDDIKKAFRELAHKYHPDKSGGDEAKFKEINEAYQVLSNDQKRQQYDQFGADFAQQGGFGGGMNWEDFMRAARGGGVYQNVDFGDLGDIFGDMFSGFGFGGATRRSTNRGRDLELALDLTFHEAVFGAEKKISIKKLVRCSECFGSGAEKGSATHTCATCKGAGQVASIQRTIIGTIQTMSACSTCHGEGKTIEKKCHTCRGDGRVMESSEITITVPAGVDNGMTLTLAGQGEAGKRGGAAGDLYLRLRVADDPLFEREGDTIYSTVAIPYSTATLGGVAEVETIDGPVELKIPSGTPSGKEFLLRGKGVPHAQRSSRGDHIVTIVVDVPSKTSKEQKKLLEDLSKLGL